jgi:hypothetical protein
MQVITMEGNVMTHRLSTRVLVSGTTTALRLYLTMVDNPDYDPDHDLSDYYESALSWLAAMTERLEEETPFRITKMQGELEEK